MKSHRLKEALNKYAKGVGQFQPGATPQDGEHKVFATLKALTKAAWKPIFANAFSVLAYSSRLYLGRCPRLEFGNAFGVQTKWIRGFETKLDLFRPS